MLVKNWMSKTLITATVNDILPDVSRQLAANNIRMVPVFDKGLLAGVVTDRDIKEASASDATALDAHELNYLLDTVKIKTIMTQNPITVPFDHTIGEAAEILIKYKISGVPVMNRENEVVGVITQTDLFRAMISLAGCKTKGFQIAFQTTDEPGSIKELSDIIQKYNGRMVSLLTSYDNVKEGDRKVYFRFYGVAHSDLVDMQNELSAKAALLYFVDNLMNERFIFQC